MKNYEAPTFITNNDLAEGIYAASGDISYTTDVHRTHTSNHDGPIWRVDVNATRTGSSPSTGQQMIIEFSTPVTVTDQGKAESHSGDGTTTITLIYRAKKANGEMMLGHIYVEPVTADIEPKVVNAVCTEYN